MASAQHVLLSPAELAFLHTSLSLPRPIRPDGRAPTQFRPLVAETGILPGTHGSARICFADGTEAIVGVKAEVERTPGRWDADEDSERDAGDKALKGENEWVELSVEIPGFRDDDTSTAFLAAMLSEALLADGGFTTKLVINSRFHWKLYLDILLISPPLSYPLPLLSLTTHLALLATRLPRLKSEGEEDPLFDDDWDASTFLYPRDSSSKSGRAAATARPPITLLVMAVGGNIIFDPSKEELAVADVALAISVGQKHMQQGTKSGKKVASSKGGAEPATEERSLRLLSVRTVDPPSRLTPPGVPNTTNPSNPSAAGQGAGSQPDGRTAETASEEGVWKAPRGGAKVAVLAAMTHAALAKNGVVYEVLDALDGVDVD